MTINATATHFVDVETTGPFVVSPNAGYINIFAELDGLLAANQRIVLSYPPFYSNPVWLSDVTTTYMGHSNIYRIKLPYLANSIGGNRSGYFRIDLQYNDPYEGWVSYLPSNTHIADSIFQYGNAVANPSQGAITSAPDNATVTIPAGVHIGHLEISGKNNLTIKGAGMTGSGATTIQCVGNASVITISNCTNLTIKDMVITNGMAETGSGINCSNSTVTIENCLIRDNRFRHLYSGGSIVPPSGQGGAIYLDNPTNSTVSVKSSIIYANHAAYGETAFVVGGKLKFDKCNLLQSNSTSNYVGGPDSFTFWNSIIKSANANLGTYNYCCSYSPGITLPGSHNIIIDDPMFANPGSGDFSLLKGSPCIGKGYNPVYDDPDIPGYDQDLITVFDETQEIGAVNFEWDRYTIYTFTDDPRGNWMCFPVIDDHSTVVIDGTPYTKDIMRAFFLQYEQYPSDMDNVSYQRYDSNGVSMCQHTPSHPSYYPMKRYLGYKALFNQDSVMPPTGKLHGYHIPYTDPVPIPVADTEWWIGYFVPETQSPFDAFANILDELYFIKAKDWALMRVPGERGAPWIGKVQGPTPNVTLSYGDMVAVRKFADSQQNEFTWFRYITIPGYQREEPEHFTFKEEPDYRPVFVEVDPLHDYRELAVMVDGDCYGAAVVDGETVMVPAYIDSVPDGAQIQIVGWDGSKSKSDPLELQIYNSNTEEFYPGTSITKEDRDFYYVKLGESDDCTDVPAPLSLEVSNYPNPFNPSTTITYTVPNDGNVKINVYNIKGQLVADLVNERKDQGSHSVIWDGKDNNGNLVSSGIYYAKLATGGKIATAKMLMLK
jgi:hypothetical protein